MTNPTFPTLSLSLSLYLYPSLSIFPSLSIRLSLSLFLSSFHSFILSFFISICRFQGQSGVYGQPLQQTIHQPVQQQPMYYRKKDNNALKYAAGIGAAGLGVGIGAYALSQAFGGSDDFGGDSDWNQLAPSVCAC